MPEDFRIEEVAAAMAVMAKSKSLGAEAVKRLKSTHPTLDKWDEATRLIETLFTANAAILDLTDILSRALEASQKSASRNADRIARLATRMDEFDREVFS